MNCQRRWLGTTSDMQTKFMLLFFGHKCLPFSLTWQVSFTCKSEFLQEIKKIKRRRKRRRKSASTWDKEIEKNSTVWKVEKGEKKERKEKQDTRRYEARVLYSTTRFQ